MVRILAEYGVQREAPIGGMLVLYHHPLRSDAPTILEHIKSFENYSQFKVWSVNTELGFPAGLRHLHFRIIVLHYSLFAFWPFQLDIRFLRYLEECHHSYKIAFFQDEHRFCQARFRFLNRFKIDCVYTLLERVYFRVVYQKYTHVKKILETLTGYVGDELISTAGEMTLSDEQRSIDVGYRSRPLEFYMGKGAQEKVEIARRFRERARRLNLRLDIEVDEQKRIYGSAWYRFVANCRAMLGVEAGVSVFDLDGSVESECRRALALKPKTTFDEVYDKVLRRYENNIYYRTISPRHFEAAAFRVCQILYEGKYSGILVPMRHYIPLKKDFSNFDQVVDLYSRTDLRRQLTDNAYTDLIQSGRYSYRSFIDAFDRELVAEGIEPDINEELFAQATRTIACGESLRRFRARLKVILRRPFPGRQVLKRLPPPVLYCYRRLLYGDYPKEHCGEER